MNTRILHCGKNIKNYYICVNKKIVGFSQKFRSGGKGDTVYLAVKKEKKSMCGVKCTLDEIIDDKPWEDADKYIQCFKIKNIEFC